MCNLGRTIRMIRQAKSLSLAEVSKAAEISTPFLSLIETGAREPSLAVIRRLATALSVPSDVLLVLAQSESRSLRTTDRLSQRLTESINKLIEAENSLRQFLNEEFDGQHAP